MFTGCAPATTPDIQSDSDKINIVSTIFPPYDFSRAIVGDKANLTMLLPPASESHSFDPTPQDILKIQNCDLFIYVGGESDDWVADVLESVDTSKMTVLTLMDCVEVVEEEIVEGMEEAEAEFALSADLDAATEPEVEPEYDEHIWTSPRNARLIVQKISDTLSEIDVTNASTYKQNTASYIAQLDQLDQKFQNVVDAAARKTLIFGDRFPFRYFADAYDLSYYAAFPGCSTQTEPSAATVKFLIDKVNQEQIPVVLHIELSNEKMANTISESTGAKVLQLHASHNISKSDFENGMTYLDIMNQNVEVLKEALN
jgi:zinc transport system substrate-binding protein